MKLSSVLLSVCLSLRPSVPSFGHSCGGSVDRPGGQEIAAAATFGGRMRAVPRCQRT